MVGMRDWEKWSSNDGSGSGPHTGSRDSTPRYSLLHFYLPSVVRSTSTTQAANCASHHLSEGDEKMCMATVATSPFPKPTLPFGGKYITEDGGKAKNKATMLAPEAADECREEAGMAAEPPPPIGTGEVL